ncbi:hypothetical protein LCGC14_0882740 [marine sediment metagenome]|uniref:Uncharacterized protein n=1 Tax=marine sediment metagenome TaxID=412755 RepID=A0A0F9RKY9_9ZZZZ
MIRKLITIILTVLILAMPVFATDVDDDGILGAAWDAPVVGNTPTGYSLSYTINGVGDSLNVEVQGLSDSSVVLTSVGDWALLSVQSYFEYWSEFQQQTVRVYSILAVSDTVVYEQAVSVDPPTGIRWE